jgi:hypothetical protein
MFTLYESVFVSLIAKRYGPSVNSLRPSMPSYLLVYIQLPNTKILQTSFERVSKLYPQIRLEYQFLFARRHLESRIEPKIAPIGVYITMRELQKPIRYTAHHFEERTAAPPVRCRNSQWWNISRVLLIFGF